MKKLLLAAGAAIGVYFIAKKLKAKKDIGHEDGIAANIAPYDNGAFIGNFSETDAFDKSNLAHDEATIDDARVVLDDGGNENGGTGGSVKKSIGEAV